MVALMRIRHFYRRSVFLFLSSFILIIIIGSINILPLPFFLRIVLVFLPYIYIILRLDLWLSNWGKAWILSTTLLIFAFLVYPNHPSVPMLLIHVIFLLLLLGIMFLYDKDQLQQRLLHQRHIKAMRVMLRHNHPSTQTVDYSREAVIILDNTGAIIDLNSQSSILLVLTESFLIGKLISDVLGILPNFQPFKIPESGEFTWVTQNKVIKHIKFRTRPLLDYDILSGTLVTLFDISEAKQNMEMRVQVAKFSVFNEVSAGLAHEIRNPLTTVKGFMQLMKPEQWPESYRPYQQIILDEIQYIEQVLSRFILLTSPTAPQFQQLSLTETIHASAQLIQPLRLRHNVTLILELSSPSVNIMADPEQLLQALLALLNNAIEASPKGGKIIIRLTKFESHVRISVIDEGHGIPNHLRDRVLDPFFTTQADSTGLGLTIAHQIILAHHGKLHFSDSKPSRGTEAMIDLPCLAKLTNSHSA